MITTYLNQPLWDGENEDENKDSDSENDEMDNTASSTAEAGNIDETDPEDESNE